jgi:hypothetical protein
LAGLIVALLSIAAFYLWPDKKWIGWLCLGTAIVLGLSWLRIEFQKPLLHFSKNYPVLSTLLVGICAGALAGLAWFIWMTKGPNLHVDDKLGLFATASNADYPIGTAVGGIKWSNRFTDLRVTINTPSFGDYRNIDLVLVPDEPVAAIGQVTNLPDVVFAPAVDIKPSGLGPEFLEGKTGKRTAIPLVLIATDGGYRMRCKELPRTTRLEIVMAIARIIDFPQDKPAPRPDFGIFNRDYVMKVSVSAGSNHWFGYGFDIRGRIEEVYKGRRFTPKTVKIDGRYTVGEREQEISQQIAVTDMVADFLHQRAEEQKK